MKLNNQLCPQGCFGIPVVMACQPVLSPVMVNLSNAQACSCCKLFYKYSFSTIMLNLFSTNANLTGGPRDDTGSRKQKNQGNDNIRVCL